jgi:hypothetical protein
VIDALPQPVNSVIRGLKMIGVSESDIYVFDVTNAWHEAFMPVRLVNKISALYPAVKYDAYNAACPDPLFLGFSTTELIHFNVPAGKPAISDRPICNVLAQADYLINVPIMKKHGMAGVTLGFKNHFGTFEHCDYAHWSVTLSGGDYTPDYNGLVDIYNNTHIRDKTILTVGDALYAARINNYNEIPSPWPSFGNQSPNSLFFSTDPVAIDSVMVDFLDEEGGVPDGSDDYLVLAAASGLGVFERWDDSHQYQDIDYQYIEIGVTPTPTIGPPPTRTGTSTPGVPANTPTATGTPLPTQGVPPNTPTMTGTPTPTPGVPTKTPTVTGTHPPTQGVPPNTPTLTGTPTATPGVPTNTPTVTDTPTTTPSPPINTPTVTPTQTDTLTPTQVVTPEPGFHQYLPFLWKMP